MASLIFAASFLTYDKIKHKRSERKERKRKTYEERYGELQKEHTEVEQKYLRSGKTGHSERSEPETNADAETTEKSLKRRSSSDSRLSRDGPSAWVDDVVREKSSRG